MAAENFKVKKGLEVGTAITATSSGVNVTGIVTATQFVGDGSGLTGVTGSGSGVVIKDEGSAVGTAGTINFVGSGVAASLSLGTATITVNAGGLDNVVEDTTPQLGGNLDLNGKFVNGTGGVNVTGVVTATTLKGNGDFVNIDVDGRADLDDIVIAGVSTFNANVNVNADITANRLVLDDDGSVSPTLTIAGDDENVFGMVLVNDTYKSSPAAGFKHTQLNNGEIQVFLRANNSAARLPYKIQQANAPSGAWDSFTIDANGAVALAHGGQQKLITTPSGITIPDLNATGIGTFGTRIDTNGVTLGTNNNTFAAKFVDNAVANFGTGNDLQISHASDVSLIRDTRAGAGATLAIGADKLFLRNKDGNENYLEATDNGSVKLFFDFAPKFETTSHGVAITGVATATSFSGSGAGLTNIPSAQLSGALPALDGSALTGVTGSGSGIIVRHDGNVVGTASSINFSTNLDVSAISAGIVTVTASGSGSSLTGTSLTLTSTDAGSSAEPIISLFRNSASPANADYLGQIKFQGESSTGVQRNYAKITGKILDVTNGSEDGILEFAHIKNGSQTITGRWRSDSLQLLNDTNLSVDGIGVFGRNTLDPDSYGASSGGIGAITDGGGWSAMGVFVHGGGTGDAAAMGHNGAKLYFGIQDGAANNSMETWLDVTPGSRIINFQTDDDANNVQIGSNKVWHAGNDGASSGLDSDLLDGQHGSYYTNASNLSSGTVPNGRFPATLPAVSGANLTALNASELDSGTIPNGRFPATLPSASGANLTALNADNISSGTLASARIEDNAVTFDKLEDVANSRILGRVSSGAGNAEELTAAQVRTLLNVADGANVGITTASSNVALTWDVVNQGTSAYRFTGPGQDPTANNPDIYLVRGNKYRFALNASGHPFQIRVSNGGSAYNDGVTNNGAQTGNVEFYVQNDAPASLVYQCTSHGGMVGNIYITGHQLTNGADNRVVTATSAYGMTGESNLTFDGTSLTIADGGKLGVNGASPQTPLDVIANGSGYAINVRGRSSDNVGEIRFTSNNYGSLYSVMQTGATYLNFQVGSVTNALRITSDGVIGINDNNPGTGKKVKVVVANNSSYQMAVNLTNNVNADINFYIKTNESLIAPSTNTPLCLGTGQAEKLRIDSNGKFLYGISTARSGFFNTASQFNPHFQIEGAGDADDPGRVTSIIYNSTTTAGPTLLFGKTNTGSVGGTGAVGNHHSLGLITFQGMVGGQFTQGATIAAAVSGTPGDDDLPTHLSFGTCEDGAASASERLRIDSTGTLITGGHAENALAVHQSTLRGVNITQNGRIYCKTDDHWDLNHVGAGLLIRFRAGNDSNATQTVVGNITLGTGNVAFNETQSDSRLKKNIEPWTDGVLQHFKTLQPKKFHFNWESDSDPIRTGYIAQDLVGAFPEAYPLCKTDIGESEEVDRHFFNPSGMVKYLMKALQEEIAKREALEARISALEGS